MNHPGGEKFKIPASEDQEKFKYIKRVGISAAGSSFRAQLLYGDLENTLVDSDDVDSVALACEKWIRDHPSLRWVDGKEVFVREDGIRILVAGYSRKNEKFVAYTTGDNMDEKLKGYLIKPYGAIGSGSRHATRYIEKKNPHSAMALADAVDCVRGALIEAVSHDVCSGGYMKVYFVQKETMTEYQSGHFIDLILSRNEGFQRGKEFFLFSRERTTAWNVKFLDKALLSRYEVSSAAYSSVFGCIHNSMGEKCNSGDDNCWKWFKVCFKTASDAQQVVGSGTLVRSSVGEEHEIRRLDLPGFDGKEVSVFVIQGSRPLLYKARNTDYLDDNLSNPMGI